jgi:transcription antitermination protein NusB
MGLRRQSREAAVQAIYMCDFLGKWDFSHVQFCFTHFSVPKSVRAYAENLSRGVLDNIVKIDSRITSASENWSITRMSRVDRSILRVVAYEIMFIDDVPHSVAINEAIEIAKRFGADESPNFINGVLDKLATICRGAITPVPQVAPELIPVVVVR